MALSGVREEISLYEIERLEAGRLVVYDGICLE